MPNNKKTTPRCLMCAGRIKPNFVFQKDPENPGKVKTTIRSFGKVADAFCADSCAAKFADMIINNPHDNNETIIKKRAEQLADCVSACRERGCVDDANRYVDLYNQHLAEYDGVKGFGFFSTIK